MKWLAIDTSTTHASIAVMNGDTIYYGEQDNLRAHAQTILPIINDLLQQAGLSISVLDGIIYGRGPGSFTGLRIACSVVKGLAYPADISVYPVSGLLAIAESVLQKCPDLPDNAQILSVIDARMHELYWGCFDKNLKESQEWVTSPAAIQCSAGPIIMAGVGFDAYLEHFPAAIQASCLDQLTVFPDARAMIRLVQQGKCQPTTAAQTLPVYVRNQVVHVKGVNHG